MTSALPTWQVIRKASILSYLQYRQESTGIVGLDAVQKYGLDVKVSSWGKPFTAVQQSKDKKQKEVLTVTLYQMADAKEMKAVFDDTVYESGKIKLKFSGTTLLARLRASNKTSMVSLKHEPSISE